MKNEWISVEERLPEDWQKILCYQPYTENSQIMVLAYSKEYFVEINDDDKFTDNPQDDGFYNYITHWMPLPKRPNP